MPVLHIANKCYSSWSLRPWALMTELGIPFTEKLHVFGEASWAEVRTRSPAGRVPFLEDGSLIVWDSLAITEYLADSHPAVWPEDRNARAFARSACAEMHSSFWALRHQCSMNVGIRGRLLAHDQRLRDDLTRLEGLFAQGLRTFGGPFLAGDRFTAVDAFFAPVSFRVRSYEIELAGEAMEYVRRSLEVGAIKKWETAALAETYRDPAHEEELSPDRFELHEDLRAK